jgi:hypothetical protein
MSSRFAKAAFHRAPWKTRRCTPQRNTELMTKEKVLGFKPQPRLEQVGDEHSERVQDRKHR